MKAPALLAGRPATAVNVMHNKLTPRGLGHEISAADAPSPEQRAWLANHLNGIRESLESASEIEVRSELAALALVLKSPRENGMESQQTGIMVSDLMGVPLFALQQACAAFRRGIAGDGVWMPTVGQIRQYAMAIVHPFDLETQKIRKVLNADVVALPVVENSRKAELLAKARSMTAQMAVRDKAKPDASQADPETPEEALERLAKTPLPKFSAELAAKLGLPH